MPKERHRFSVGMSRIPLALRGSQTEISCMDGMHPPLRRAAVDQEERKTAVRSRFGSRVCPLFALLFCKQSWFMAATYAHG